MMPLEYMCGCIGMGRSASLTKTTSGGSMRRTGQSSRAERSDALQMGARTDRVRRTEPELEPVDLVCVNGVLVEDADVE